jgi:hypothetical protein
VHNDTNQGNVIRIDDLDESLYRIYALDKFEALLASRCDALVNPTKWQDPFENFFLEATVVMDEVSGQEIPLKTLAADWYGQCWSTEEETDAMWRIYSSDPNIKGGDPGKIGIKVKTTIRKLFDNLKRAGSTAPYLQFFVGRVEYETEAEIIAVMETLTFGDVSLGGQGDKFAELLCIKREAFRHEQEVRLLFQDIDPKRGADKLFKYELDANGVFEEAILDPRLRNTKTIASVESTLRTAGCTLPIWRSTLYQAPHFVIPIQ